MHTKKHWEKIYSTKATNKVSWFQQHAEHSLKLIRKANTPATASIIDVGGGASILVDELLADGYQNITVLDIAREALSSARTRLGDRQSEVQWLEANILDTELPDRAYDLWHDRAVFHFLTSPEDRHTYIRTMLRSVKQGGLIIIATFAEDGPTTCSGLPVMRYSVEELHAEVGDSFLLLGHERELHQTPTGNEQSFIYCLFRKTVP
ncbi:class I SAM-dependent methyltransferase [Methylophaga sp. OBS4]|uniref:class I SAM-dependent methyltransferase n=1 Tax=Methylophaga sp. OBS4 TaxID=2991935 RepID=UPI00224F5376|nr:class I SAM-dependent methyltransferase [Methylophaga sp. OBS4]MCX4186283.1 class I SAM-dependent methyltransferase [Methylophaga sp. OBS4]